MKNWDGAILQVEILGLWTYHVVYYSVWNPKFRKVNLFPSSDEMLGRSYSFGHGGKSWTKLRSVWNNRRLTKFRKSEILGENN